MSTPEENARGMRYDEMNRQVKSFHRRLKLYQTREQWGRILDLWNEVENWCNENMWPDNWHEYERAAEDAMRHLTNWS